MRARKLVKYKRQIVQLAHNNWSRSWCAGRRLKPRTSKLSQLRIKFHDDGCVKAACGHFTKQQSHTHTHTHMHTDRGIIVLWALLRCYTAQRAAAAAATSSYVRSRVQLGDISYRLLQMIDIRKTELCYATNHNDRCPSRHRHIECMS